MIELRTLGTLDVRDASDGRVLQSVLAQPKRAAFLAYLALSGPGRFHRRDTLLGVFWPEVGEKQARHSLSQAVYVLRRTLGPDALVTRGEEELALSFDQVHCDAVEFDARLASGATESALELYGGELLHGFHLADSTEFESWLSKARLRLQVAAVTAARELAAASEGVGNTVGAVRWLRRAVEWASYDEALVRELMSKLERAGDRSGALLEYEALSRRLQRDLEMEPAAETMALVEFIRAGNHAPAVESPAPAEHRAVTAAVTPASRPLSTPRPVRLRSAVLLTIALLVAGAGTIVVWRTRPAAAVADPVADRLAVLPFEVRGSARMDYLGEGMALLLSAKLDGAGPLRSVDPEAVLNYVDGRHGEDGAGLGRAVARRFGAAQYALGSVVEAGGRISLQVGLYDADGTLRVQATADAADESGIFAIVDDVARTLIASRYGDVADRLSQLAARTTLSLPALKAYLAGERAFRRGRFSEAASAFERAAVADSTFALAHYRLSLASLWADVPDTLPFDADARALRHAARLSEHDHQLLVAYDAWRRGDATEAERIYRNVLALYPDDAEAAHQLGETLFHYNPLRGRAISEAREPFERVLRVDPTNWGALWHLMLLAGSDRRAADFDALGERLHGLDAEPAKALELRVLEAFAAHDEAAIATVEAELRAAHPLQVHDIAWRIAVHLHQPADARRVARLAVTPDRHPFSRQMAHVQLAYLELALGRDRAATHEIREGGRVRSTEPTDALLAYRAVLPFRERPRAELEELRADLAAPVWPDATMEYRIIHAYMLGTIDVALGDTAAALEKAALMELRAADLGVTDGYRPLAEALRAEVAYRGGRRMEALQRLEQAPLERWFGWATSTPILSNTQTRWLRAEVLREMGRLEEALGWYASFGEHAVHDLVFLAPSHQRRAEIHELLGQRAAAARHYAAVIDLWRHADPEFQPVVEEARRRLAAIARSN